jgi:hypothetical protein
LEVIMDSAARFRRSLLQRLLRVSAASALVLAGLGAAGCGENKCIKPAQAGACPSREEAKSMIGVDCGERLVSVDSDAEVEGDLCCYDITTENEENACCPPNCVIGRPFIVEEHVTTAEPRAMVAWMYGDVCPATGELTARDRGILAVHWTRAALLEHASIASFSRFSLELLAAGAPPELVVQAQNAALDEIAHARASFTLAAAYQGKPIGPSVFPFAGGAVQVRSDLSALAAAVAWEGCIGETAAAIVASEQLARATDPAVRSVLGQIAADEARHADLAWRTVRWALAEGGAPVRAALAKVFGTLTPGHAAPIAEMPGVLADHGCLDNGIRDAVMARAIAEVVLPCARALLAAPFEQAGCTAMV